MVADDASWEPMESEYIVDVKVRNAIDIYLICGESKMHLLCIQVDVGSDGYVYIAIDPLAR